MKTRILHTRFWKDNFVSQLNRTEKLIFVYLLTNENINITGVYELPDKFIKTDLEITQSELDQAKSKLQTAGKFIFANGWVKVVNADKYNSYNGEKLEKAREREKAETPDELILGGYGIDTSMDTSIHTPNNHKSLIYSNYNKIEDIKEEDFKKLSEDYSVPLAFVKSKFDDLKNWHDSNPQKNYYKNYLSALRNWVKRDSIKIKERQYERNSKISIINTRG
jgi:hypothetical protein